MSGQQRHAVRRWMPMLPAAVVGLATTLVVLPAGVLPAAFDAPELHLVLETANVLVGLLVALLVFGRYRTDRRLDQLLLIDALLALAAANTALAVSAGVGESATADTLRWASTGVRVLGSALLCASALIRPRVRVTPAAATASQVGLVLLVAGGVAALAVSSLPPPVRDVTGGLDTASPTLEVHPAVTVAQGAAMVILGVAAAVLTRRAVAGGDALTRWLAAGTILAAFARVHYLLYPSLLSDVVYTGDALRAGFYGCLLVGALREIEGYWTLRARAAVLDERRRIARELHDGMTQELTYILAQTRTADGPSDARALARIEDASTRALDEARRAIDALDREDRRPFVVELNGAAADLAGRYDVAVAVEPVGSGVGEPGPEAAEQLLRIVGESVRNAVRHGRAQTVRISLRRSGRTEPMPHQLTVADDGVGFDPDAPPHRAAGGYGLVSMRDRAASIHGVLSVDSAPGHGARVTVTW